MKANNNAKLREALLDLERLIFDGEIQVASVIIQNALAEPLRNCDVGTAEEQAKRFKSYCNSKVCKRNVCHSVGYEELFHHKCFPIWAQMPYEEGSAE